MKQKRGKTPSWVVAVPGRIAAPRMTTLPAGAWQISADQAELLASTDPVVNPAIHVATGAAFRLMSVPDGPILSICPEDKAAWQLMVGAIPDPSGWANRQQWRISAPSAKDSPEVSTRDKGGTL